jgi:phospholipid-transporting ATPase
MSTVVRGPDGKIKLYCKGADTVILERLAPSQSYTEKTVVHLEVHADHFLRALHTEQLYLGLCHRGTADALHRFP